jgi:hypothetical protein
MNTSDHYTPIFWWLLLWTVPGLLLPAGLLFLPFGAMIFWPLTTFAVALLIKLHRPRGPEVLGVLVGIAAWAFTVAYFNRDSVPCSESGAVHLRSGESFSCGGVAAEPFLIAGIALTFVALSGAAISSVLIGSADRRRRRLAEPDDPG